MNVRDPVPALLLVFPLALIACGKSEPLRIPPPEPEPADVAPEAPPAPPDVPLAPDADDAAGEAETLEPPAESVVGPLGLLPHLFCPSEEPTPPDLPLFFFSPDRPRAGAPLRLVVVSDTPLAADRIELELDGERRPVEGLETWGGPPWAWSVRLPQAPAGRLRFCLVDGATATEVGCRGLPVPERLDEPSTAPLPSGIWRVERAWNRNWENLYSAWIARLFLVEPGLGIGWRPLHQATRDARRNLLFDHLGLAEDDPEALRSATLGPDCGDLPFFLRAYFAWKLRLPFALHLCPRGGPDFGSICGGAFFTNLTPTWDRLGDPVERFNRFLAENVAVRAHSASGSARPDEEYTDLYPVAFEPDALRPGTVFIDPRGHVLVLTRWLTGTEDRIGTFFAVDGHPDQSLSHKRFSPSVFHYNPRTQSAGFKTFRPPRYHHGLWCFTANRELDRYPPPARRSLDQYGFPDAAAFHARLEGMLNPFPPEPVAAYRDRMALLIEMLVDRETAVRVGVDFMESTGWANVRLPDSRQLFFTTGAWEDYATPGRDLRLLIAADELRDFPALVAESPGLFRLPEGSTPEQLAADLAAALERGRQELSVVYRRSDGSEWTLTLGEFLDRLTRFEMAYNPNDCPELRWGALEGTDEYAPCVRRAPAGQRRLMEAYRAWFSERRQPSAP